MDKFQIDERVLEGCLFTQEEAKVGPITSLNVNYLPHFSANIQRKLNRKEQCCLIEFELQTYLLELAICQLKFKCLKDLSSSIIRDMRMTAKFWIPSSEVWNEIQLRLKLYHVLVVNCQEIVIKKTGGKRALNEILMDATALRKYIAQLDFSRLDYKSEFLRIPEVSNLVGDYDRANSQNKQLFAIDTFCEQQQALQQIKQKSYEYVPTPQQQQKNQNVDLLGRVNQPQLRETRHSKQPTEQMSYRDIRMILKEQQKVDMEERRTIFVPNQVYKYQKIDIVILPYIYQFIFRDVKEYTKCHLRIQNLILFLVLSDSEVYKANKQKKSILLTDSGEHKTAQKSFLKHLTSSNDSVMINFDKYCTSQGVCLAYYFSSTPSNYRKELILIRNIIILAMKFANQLLGVPFKFDHNEILAELEIDDDKEGKQWKRQDYSNDYVYFQVLIQLEYYYNIPQDQYEKLLMVYENHYEVIMTSKRDHFKEYFGVLRSAKKQLFGLRSSEEQVETSIQMYINYINSPKTQGERSYLYHSDKRSEWTHEQYKTFLEGLNKYFDIVVNNRKIAKYMGDIDPNHVRFVKGKYLRSLKKRAKERNLSRKDILQSDIDNFDPEQFEKVIKKTKI